MKKILKKNQIIITVLVVMVAAAGYLNYSGTKSAQTKKTTAEATQTADLNAVKEDIESLDMDITDETALLQENQNASADVNSTISETDETKDGQGSSSSGTTGSNASDDKKTEDTAADAATDVNASGEVPGEAVLTSAASAAYVSQARVEREQIRSQNKEALMEIINNASLTEEEIREAVDSMVEMTDSTERETAAETLLEAQGFANAIVNVTGDTVDVIVDAASLDDSQRAQIEDAVKRKTGVSVENIVITPVSSVESDKTK
ncbi:MAG TPA: stage III sporulation protein AH [Lachnospiraceae bacterium]|nr:stage III sporulation protein AH [Lachnospiraceae bacterium]